MIENKEILKKIDDITSDIFIHRLDNMGFNTVLKKHCFYIQIHQYLDFENLEQFLNKHGFKILNEINNDNKSYFQINYYKNNLDMVEVSGFDFKNIFCNGIDYFNNKLYLNLYECNIKYNCRDDDYLLDNAIKQALNKFNIKEFDTEYDSLNDYIIITIKDKIIY